MKLELKHLAPYLPYGLKIKFNVSGNIGMLEYINTKRCFAGSVEEESSTDEYYLCDYIDNIKPILRPLSDLTKEIEVDGKKFVPIDRMLRQFSDKYSYYYNEGEYSLLKSKNDSILLFINNKIAPECNFGISTILFKWHFDVFGLIKEGLAIDINTLES